MSKSKVYKKKRKQANAGIFVVLAVVLVVLIIAVVIFTSIDNSKYNGLVEDYTEFAYGEKQNVSLNKVIDNTGMNVYVSDDYYYYPNDNIIYDIAKNESAVEAFSAKVEELGADFGTIDQAVYATHTDGSDFTKEYDYVQISITYDGVLGGEEAVAEKIWSLIDALNDEYNVCGLYFGYSDNEAYYQVAINVTDKEPVTLEKIQESISSINLTGAEVVQDEADVDTEVESETETEGADEAAE